MTKPTFTTISYEGNDLQVSWHGVSMEDGDGFNTFITNDVVSRLHDEEGTIEFEAHLRGLANTGFARNSLDAILAAEIPEERNWAIGEAMAEAYLESKHNITWPWNMERDKRNPKASLSGADLVGFKTDEDGIRLALGEVKTSTDVNTPPSVMSGRSGMTQRPDTFWNTPRPDHLPVNRDLSALHYYQSSGACCRG